MTLPAIPPMLLVWFALANSLAGCKLDSSWVKLNCQMLPGMHVMHAAGELLQINPFQKCTVWVLGHWHQLFPTTTLLLHRCIHEEKPSG